MRQLGKCDECRQRKVKCDEKKPACSCCEKRGRSCNYPYPHGQGFALVIQDPSQMTRYGRSIIAPVIQPLAPLDDNVSTSTPDSRSEPSSEDSPIIEPEPNNLHLRSGLVAANGQGIFQTLAPANSKQRRISKKVGESQRKRWQEHILRLQAEGLLTTHRPNSPESRLTAMFIDMLHPSSPQHQPLCSLGDWIRSIPSRISSSPVVSIAAEFFVHSLSFHQDQSHSNKILALQTKSNALKQLQLSILSSRPHPTYDLVVATKLHYSAEVLLAVDKMHYAIHALGLLALLESGIITGVDEEHFWNVIDSTYIDDASSPMMNNMNVTNNSQITIAVTAGRPSVYDHDVYLTATHPAALSVQDLSPPQRVKMAMMHCLIQCPRLVIAVRDAIRGQNDKVAIATAVNLANTLWNLSQEELFAAFIDSRVLNTYDKTDEAVADIVPNGIRFNTAQNMVVGTRYWMLQILLCGCLDTLHRKFPYESRQLNLPSPETVHQVDTHAGTQLGRVALGLDNEPSPLTLLRTHGPLSVSTGAWHRQIRYLISRGFPSSDARVLVALRMQKWILEKCNIVLERMNVSQADECAWIEALDCMAGEELADWMPSKVTFDTEDGEMVMKLEYSGRTANDNTRTRDGEGDGITRTFNIRDPARFGPQHLRGWVRGEGSPIAE